MSKFNLDVEDYAELLNIQDEFGQRIKQFVNALSKNDQMKARQILGKKSDWGNIIEYYTLKLYAISQARKLDELSPDELEAVHYLIDYILSIDTLYIRDFVIVSVLLDCQEQFF